MLAKVKAESRNLCFPFNMVFHTESVQCEENSLRQSVHKTLCWSTVWSCCCFFFFFCCLASSITSWLVLFPDILNQLPIFACAVVILLGQITRNALLRDFESFCETDELNVFKFLIR